MWQTRRDTINRVRIRIASQRKEVFCLDLFQYLFIITNNIFTIGCHMKVLAKNKRAYADYEIIDTYEAGLMLLWHETKACKLDHISIKESIARFDGRELFLMNMQIPLYSKAHPTSAPNYDPKRARKLLLTNRELTNIFTKVNKTWYTVVPLEIYEDKYRRIKLKIWVWKLMRKYEKKQVLKDKDTARQMDKSIKELKL